jgi:hypothetical protein
MNDSQVLAALGVKDVRQLNNAPNFFYCYVFRFAALAAGASTTVTQKIASGRAFIVDAITGRITGDAAAGSVAAGGALAENSEISAASAWGVSLSISTTRGPWQQDDVPFPAIVGSGREPFFPLFKPALFSGADVSVKFTNNTAVVVSGALVLVGHTLGN